MKQTTVENCPHCAKAGDGKMCGKHGQGWCCTKPAGHTGDHVACGKHAHDIISWPHEGTKIPAAALIAALDTPYPPYPSVVCHYNMRPPDQAETQTPTTQTP